MPNEYAVNQSDLVLVADAIRNKNETLEALEFPDGFVESIEKIKVGGGVVVKAYESEDALPSSADDGEIALISSTAVANVYAQSTEPNEQQEGNVWIVFAANGKLPAVGGNVIIYPQKAYQYKDGAWDSVAMKVYKDGMWVDATADAVIYEPGNEAEEITGGWYAASAKGLIKSAYGMGIYDGFVSTALKIDLTHYSLLKVNVICESGASSYVGIGSVPTEFVASTATGGSETAAFTRVVDLEAITGNYYIMIQSRSGSAQTTVYKVELIA